MSEALARPGGRRRSRRGAALLAAAALAWAVPAAASPAFHVDHLSTYLRQGVYYMDADFSLPLNERAHDALSNGVALTFVLDIHIVRRRRLLWNVVVARLRERYRLSYRPLTENYRVRNLNSGAEESYGSLPAALAAVSHVRDLPLVDTSVLAPKTRYFVAVRIVLDTKDLPGPLKLIAAVVPGWQLASDWRREALAR